jgi:hypothetical protein
VHDIGSRITASHDRIPCRRLCSHHTTAQVLPAPRISLPPVSPLGQSRRHILVPWHFSDSTRCDARDPGVLAGRTTPDTCSLAAPWRALSRVRRPAAGLAQEHRFALAASSQPGLGSHPSNLAACGCIVRFRQSHGSASPAGMSYVHCTIARRMPRLHAGGVISGPRSRSCPPTQGSCPPAHPLPRSARFKLPEHFPASLPESV